MRSLAHLLLSIVIVPLIAGCSMILPQSGPVAVEQGAAPGQAMVFPECQTAELAFAGESTLSALGLGDFAGPDADKVGMIWVTAGPAAFDMPQPVPAGGGKGVPMPAGRMVCVQWPDGSGMANTIPDDWVLPASVAGTTAPDEGTASLPIGMLAVVGGAVVLVGVSVLAFRRDGA